ncbi:MAG: DUF1330 domain-containing protein [Pseudomonadota bacterium]
MAKGYWIAHVEVTDPEPYSRYAAGTPDVFGEFGGTFLVRAGTHEEVEGPLSRPRNVVIEFPSYQAALDCYRSEAYQTLREHRVGAGIASITIVEGVES